MNPDNNAPSRTYFIGGPPRVGKTQLSYALARSINGHVIPTDAIRDSVKQVLIERTGPLFRINEIEHSPPEDWLRLHYDGVQDLIAIQNDESAALWRSIVSFTNSFGDDEENHIVEGVAILPELVNDMKLQPSHVIFVGNTSEEHVNSILRHAETYKDRDWMSAIGYTEEKIRAMAHFVREMSLYFKVEAEKYGFSYYEIDGTNFEESVTTIIKEIMES